jgi:hypothetical protein
MIALKIFVDQFRCYRSHESTGGGRTANGVLIKVFVILAKVNVMLRLNCVTVLTEVDVIVG